MFFPNVFLVCVEMFWATNLTYGRFTGTGGDVLILEGTRFEMFEMLQICALTNACSSCNTPVARCRHTTEAAYCDEGFFYEVLGSACCATFACAAVAIFDSLCCTQTIAPILSIGSASLVAISTLTSEINFYTRLVSARDCSAMPVHGRLTD